MENQDKDSQLSLDELKAKEQHENSSPETTAIDRTAAIRFHGKTGEYYSIWIVNFLLTIVTLGIYSAWAKVRTQRYFHANTEVDGHRFSYLASPLQILKGRIIALTIFASFYLISSLSPAASGVLILIYFIAVPWLLCKSLKFNMQMVGYRNIRFNFHGKYGQAFLVFMVYPFLSIFTLYLALPMALKAIDRFICENISYGDKPFTTNLATSVYYKAAFGAVFIGIVLFSSAILVLGIEMSSLFNPEQQVASPFIPLIMMATYLATFVIAGAFYTTVVRNHMYANTQIEDIATFESNLTLKSLVWLNFSNLIALVCTLGLALPWVKIRSSQYFCQMTQVSVLPGADSVVAKQSKNTNAIGDEVAEIFDIDIAIG